MRGRGPGRGPRHSNDGISAGHLILRLLTEPEAISRQDDHRTGVPLQEGPAGSPPRCSHQPRKRCPLRPFDQQAEEHCELTFQEALRLGRQLHRDQVHILLALLELEDSSGLLTGLGIDKTATEANITATVAAIAARKEQEYEILLVYTHFRPPSVGHRGNPARRHLLRRRCAGRRDRVVSAARLLDDAVRVPGRAAWGGSGWSRCRGLRRVLPGHGGQGAARRLVTYHAASLPRYPRRGQHRGAPRRRGRPAACEDTRPACSARWLRPPTPTGRPCSRRTPPSSRPMTSLQALGGTDRRAFREHRRRQAHRGHRHQGDHWAASAPCSQDCRQPLSRGADPPGKGLA